MAKAPGAGTLLLALESSFAAGECGGLLEDIGRLPDRECQTILAVRRAIGIFSA
jgi:hypothetical protein